MGLRQGNALDSLPGRLMLDREVVRVVGKGWNVDFNLDDQVPCGQLVEGLRRYLRESRGWFAGGPVTVKVGRRIVCPEELVQLREVLEEEFRLKVAMFCHGTEDLEQLISDEVGVPVQLTSEPAAPPPVEVTPELPVKPLVLKSTCRSGAAIRHGGDVMVLGDVNPGAQITAGGDIVVMGSLRGIAHAGADSLDSTDSVIVALSLRPLQLRIGRHYSVDSTDKRDRAMISSPEIAYVGGGSIIVAPFTSWFQRTPGREGI
jgi:septum site-determining protein MinC